MPQPLSRVLPNAGYHIGGVGDQTLLQRPALAQLAMMSIATWSHVENFMLTAYIALAGGAASDAAAVFLSLDTSRAKSSAISALAERKLDADTQKLLRAILRLLKSAESERNKLAHWIWGYSDELPNALLLADPRTLVDVDIQNRADLIYVYKERDFTDLAHRFSRLAGFGQKFHFIIIDHPANWEGRLYDTLCSEPEIRDKLDRQA